VRPRFAAGFLIAIGSTIIATSAVGWLFPESNELRALWWTLFACIVVWLSIVSVEKRGMLHSLGMLLGNASYSIYLTHAASLIVMIQISSRLHNPLPVAAFLGLSVVASVFAGTLIHWYVELPLIAYCRRVGRKLSIAA
jgi:exopolysaccharide production protein ExoZ